MNKVILLGNVGKDPEVKTFESGTIKVSFPLATTEKWKDKDGNKQESTEWHNCELWGKRAEVIQKYVKKGDKLYVEGKIKTESWEKEGEKKYTTKISVTDFEFIGGKSSGSGQVSEAQAAGQPEQKVGEDGLPF